MIPTSDLSFHWKSYERNLRQLPSWLVVFISLALLPNEPLLAQPKEAGATSVASKADFELSGQIFEKGTQVPIEGAQVSIVKDGEPIEIIMSDGLGRFTSHVTKSGVYSLSVTKDGYLRVESDAVADPSVPPPFPGVAPSLVQVSVTSEKPRAVLNLQMVRASAISGVVIDRQTRQPISNLHLVVVALSYPAGTATFLQPRTIVTGRDGRFVAEGLDSGKWIVKTAPDLYFNQPILHTFSEADLDIADEDYDVTLWPGGFGLDQAIPIDLISGQRLEMPALALEKVSYYRALVHFPAVNCTPGDEFMMYLNTDLRRLPPAGPRFGTVACGTDVLVRGLRPGSYWIDMLDQKPRPIDTRLFAQTTLEVGNRNAETSVQLARGPSLEGTLVLPDNFNGQVRLGLVQRDFFPLLRQVTLSHAGTFVMPNLPMGSLDVIVTATGNGYIEDLQYNGVPVTGRSFRWNGTGTFRIVVDDNPAAVQGRVSDERGIIERPTVVLIKWPIFPENPIRSIRQVVAGNDGSFRFTGVSSGEYRILALSSSQASRITEPGLLERVLGRAEKLTLSRGSVGQMNLKILDLSR